MTGYPLANTDQVKPGSVTSWNDLLKPEYKGRVGLASMGSTLVSAWMAEIARLNGGSAENLEPAFAYVKKLMPNVGAVAANPGAKFLAGGTKVAGSRR